MSAQDIKMVKEFNSWRRGGDDVHADDKAYTKRLGDALDAVVAMAERAEEMERALKVIYTWAGVDGALVPEHVRALTKKVLRRS